MMYSNFLYLPPSIYSFRLGGFGPFDIFIIVYFGLIVDL